MTSSRAALLVLALAVPTFGWAQGPIKPLLLTSVSGDDSKQAVIVSGVLPPGASTGLHTHPGDEYTTVLQGTLELRAEGSAPRRVSAGEAYHNPRGLVHEARNVGEGPARVSITFILDKGKPITVPAQ